jgi:RHS repeat-associated protein
VTREYYAEGEYVPGAPAQPYYYGPDQIGSVRRVFASASSAPAYSYDAYGNALQSTAPLTDFNYAGMFYNADSGLYLTQYRAYDPVSGRWLSRDPIGELGARTQGIVASAVNANALQTNNSYIFTSKISSHDGRAASNEPSDRTSDSLMTNLYPYVGGNPISRNDLKGEQWGPVIAGLATMAALTWEWYEYYSHFPPVPQTPALPPPLLPPKNSCNASYPQGPPSPEVRNYTPRPQVPTPEFQEPPEPPEWPQ